MQHKQQNFTTAPVAVVSPNTIINNNNNNNKNNNESHTDTTKIQPNSYLNYIPSQTGFVSNNNNPYQQQKQQNAPLITQNLNETLSPQHQQNYNTDAYSPHTPYQSIVPFSNNPSYQQQQQQNNIIQNPFSFTPTATANSISHRSSSEMDYNNLTRSFSNQSDFSNRLSNMTSVDMLETSKKYTRADSNGNQPQTFDHQLNPISQFYRSGSINELSNNNNQMFFKNNSTRSSQHTSYNPVASFYSSSSAHLNGTAILDEEDFGNIGFDNINANNNNNNNNFNKNFANRNNSQGTLMTNYLSGRTSTGSISFNNGNLDNPDNYESSLNYSYVNSNNPQQQQQQQQQQQGQFRHSFGQQSSASSNGNYNNNATSPFAQSEGSFSINPGFNDSQQQQLVSASAAAAYRRSSFGSNYSSGNTYTQQAPINNGMRNSTGFVPDFCYNSGNDMFAQQTSNKVISPDKTFDETSNIHIATPQTSSYQSRKTSTSSNSSNRPFSTNTSGNLTSEPINKKSYSITSDKSNNHHRSQNTTNSINSTNPFNNSISQQQQQHSNSNTKCGSLSKSSSNSSATSSTNLNNPIAHIPVKPPVDQDALLSFVRGNGISFNDSLNKHEVSSDLQNLYDQIGSNYFSQDLVFKFIKDLKSKLKKEFLDNQNCNSKLNKFIKYLISSNEQFSLIDHLTEDKPFITTQGKQLALVALKNGKLELLTVNKQFSQSNNLKSKNLIIIDGDRGVDLAMVVLPSLSFPMAVLVNFLKKKIHFDSLITDKSNHYKNSMFISAILAQAKHVMGSEPLMDPINPKLYDLTELTQLIIPSKQVVKFATTLDVTDNLYGKFQEELKALRFATTKLNNLNKSNANSSQNPLDIKILNSEYQFDKKKLTFYYLCEKRNDFRDLIKELFKFYKTRIWLCAIPNNLNIYQQHYFKRELLLVNGGGGSSKGKNDSDDSVNVLNDKPFDKIVLDNFQIAVYIELMSQLF